ncbi:peptidyl-prolyl cis-trans isomerase [Myxococcus sp. RHSTA-1-4]|uniref:peptidylprolyl isomerase n=1 Tax=Myxococcus sp. RHSTA-1-4 TaxID=2874601 RepID=UPI001CBBB74A|nr:peptidyl-prolyl cis-trans isomerase [Myxococcus sp. RHSTA-1-4]MBZ4417635.1 peptidyl-prolyl cis-trans isomerase [Myxococcus sp. RHSTA-1-4]
MEATSSRPRSRPPALRWWLAAGLLPIALGGFAALSASGERMDLPEEEEVAFVNDKPVSLERFNRLLAFTAARVTTADGRIPDADALLLKNAIVEKLIDEAVTDAAAKEQGLEVEEKEIDAAYEAFAQSFPTSEAFKQYLERTPDGSTAIRGDIRQRLLRERLAKQDAAGTVSYDEVKRYYESHPGAFHQPQRVSASEVLVLHADDAYARAKELREKVLQGSIAFADAARKFSEGPTRDLGGARVDLTEATLEAHVWKALVELEPGQLTEVLETKEGYSFLLVHEVLPELDLKFEEVQPEIQARLERLYADARLQGLLPELRSKAFIKNLFAERYADLLKDLLKPGTASEHASFSLPSTSSAPEPVPAGPEATATSQQSRPRP